MTRASRPTPRRSSRGGWETTVEMGSGGHRVRRHVRGRTKGEVAAKIAQLEAQRQAAGGWPGKPPTLDEWLGTWVAGRTLAVRPKTVAGYRVDMRHISCVIGSVRLDRLRSADVESLYRSVLESGCSTGTVHHVRRTLSAALNSAVDQGYLSRNPVRAASTPRLDSPEVEPLTAVEVQAVLDAATRTRHPARWSLAVAFGLRQGEALGLCWDDVDWEQGTVTVRRSLARRPWQHGCDGTCHERSGARCPRRHSGGLVLDEVKSRAGVRTLALPPVILDQLHAVRRAQAADRLAAGELWRPSPHGGYVFATPLGAPVDPRNDHRRWKTLLGDASVRAARLHDARHTAATGLLILGVDARTVMSMLGWSQLSMTERYQHVVPELVQEAARRVGEYRWPTSASS